MAGNKSLDNLKVMLGSLNDAADFYEGRNKEQRALQNAVELEKQKHEMARAEQDEMIKKAQEIAGQYAGEGKRVSVGFTPGGGVSLSQGDQDDMSKLIQLLGLKATMGERSDKKLEHLQEDVTKSGAPQAVESLKRAEKAVPGVLGGKAKFKSVGGVKNLAPNIAVPLLEKMGIMDKGASDERAALQELQNAKIYDSSGKQINESEMQRIKQAMGMSGVFNPNTINEATKQIGDTVLRKNQNITAGYPQETVDTFRQRGGVAGAKSLSDLLSTSQPQPQAAPAPVEDPIEAELRRRGIH